MFFFWFSDLLKSHYTFGRAADRDIVFDKSNFKPTYLNTISKHHFEIIREELIGSDGYKQIGTFLIDTSQNGTFVNSEIVGKSKRHQLRNDDVISLAEPNKMKGKLCFCTFYNKTTNFLNTENLYHFFVLWSLLGVSSVAVYMYMDESGLESVEFPPEIVSNYAVSRTLGSGACGEVKMAFLKKTNKKFAIKIISKKNFIFEETKKILNEIEILKKLKHVRDTVFLNIFNFIYHF